MLNRETVPSYDWATDWLGKHSDVLRTLTPRKLEKSRVDACVASNIEPWFDMVSREVDISRLVEYIKRHSRKIINNFFYSRIPGSWIFNMDETWISRSGKLLKVIVPRDWREAPSQGPDEKTIHITVIFSVCADGTYCPLTLILPKLKTLPADLQRFSSFIPISASENGWITKDIFEEWVKKIFLPFLSTKRIFYKKQDQPALLVLDGQDAHLDRREVGVREDQWLASLRVEAPVVHDALAGSEQDAVQWEAWDGDRLCISFGLRVLAEELTLKLSNLCLHRAHHLFVDEGLEAAHGAGRMEVGIFDGLVAHLQAAREDVTTTPRAEDHRQQ